MAIEDPKSDHYAVLGIAAAATYDDIRKAHRALIREVHPDRGGEPMSAASVNIARDVLLDPISRSEYDQARHDWRERDAILLMMEETRRRSEAQRAQAREPPPAEPSQPHSSAPQAHAAGDSQQDASAADAPRREWQSFLTKALVASEFSKAVLAGQWFTAMAIMGAAHILDRVIENRVGADPAQRQALDELATTIGKHHAVHVVETLVSELGVQWDAAAGRWVTQRSRPPVRAKKPAARPSTQGHGRAPARNGAPSRPAVAGRAGRRGR